MTPQARLTHGEARTQGEVGGGMTLISRAKSGSYSVIIAAAGLVALGALIRQSPVAWGADPDSPLPGRVEEAVRLEPVVVSASRVEQRLRDVPANVTVITREDIAQSPARTVDDLLRQVPGFSLFRRSSSIVTHPTAQGVSLRGIGPSGVSRTLVLVDGVPLNDPFGGWVYWSKVPLESIERIEVTRGGGSGVYGNYALGGVINIVTRRPEARAAQAKIDVGTRDTVDADPGLHFTTPMMQLQDAKQTKVLIVTLAETTPVLEAANLQADLRRAGIEPWAWVVNNSVAAAAPRSLLLRRRAANELREIASVAARHARRYAVVPLLQSEPVGVERLLELCGSPIDAVPP